MESVQWKVEGMHCSNCAITIHKYLEKKGMKNVKVNFANGDVFFDLNGNYGKAEIAKGIDALGYSVQTSLEKHHGTAKFLNTNFQRFLFCLVFTIVLWFHMIPG